MSTNAGPSGFTCTPIQAVASTSRLGSTPLPDVLSSSSANPSMILSSPSSITSSSSISLPHPSQLLEPLSPRKTSGRPVSQKGKGKEKAREPVREVIVISDSDSYSAPESPPAPHNGRSANSSHVSRLTQKQKQKQTVSHYPPKSRTKLRATPIAAPTRSVRPASLSQSLAMSQSKKSTSSTHGNESSDIEISGFDAAFRKPFPFDSEFLKNEKAKRRSRSTTATGKGPGNATSVQPTNTKAAPAPRVTENAVAGPSGIRRSSTPAGAAGVGVGATVEADNQWDVDWYMDSEPEEKVRASGTNPLGGETDALQEQPENQGMKNNGVQVQEDSDDDDDDDDIYADAPDTETAAVPGPTPPAQEEPPEAAVIPAPAVEAAPPAPADLDAQENTQDVSEDAYKSATAQIMEIVPYADRARVDTLLRANMSTYGAMTVQMVLAAFLEDGDSGPVPVPDADLPAHEEVPEAPLVASLDAPAEVPEVAQAPVVVVAAPAVADAPAPPEPAVAAAAQPEQAPQPVTAASIEAAMRQVLEVIPDVQRAYLRKLLDINLPTLGERTTELVIGNLLENEGVWPKETNEPALGQDGAVGGVGGQGHVQRKEKGRVREDDAEDDEEGGHKRAKIDYARADRPHLGGSKYMDYALMALQCSFPRAPKPHLRAQLLNHFGHYAPTHLALKARERLGQPGYKPKRTASSVANLEMQLDLYQRMGGEPVFWEERAWVQAWDAESPNLQESGERVIPTAGNANAVDANAMPDMAAGNVNSKGKERAIDPEPLAEQEPGDDGGIECQCCFGEYEFDKMVQCPEAHLFCSGCLASYAATQLGEHKTALVCMHPDGCAEPFPPTELARALDSKLMALYERLVQSKAITDAGLEGLEECPFCEWKCVLEPQGDETRFWCMNKEKCGVVSCRLCKKSNHLPKTCEEAEKDKHLDGRHAIEEAMTRALMRNCPKCKKPFIKELGCNKMICPNCQTLSCYVCRQVIKGYDHFHQNNPNVPGTSAKANGKCLLWDAVEERHSAEVKAAAEKAMREYKAAHPDADEEEIRVAVEGPRPKTPPPQPARAGLVPGPAQIGHAGAWNPALAVQIPGFYAMPHERQQDMMRQNMLRQVAMAGGGAQIHPPGLLRPPPPGLAQRQQQQQQQQARLEAQARARAVEAEARRQANAAARARVNARKQEQAQERARIAAQLAELDAAANADFGFMFPGRHQMLNARAPGPVHGVAAPRVHPPAPLLAPQNANPFGQPRANLQLQIPPPMQHDAQLAEMRARVEAQRALMERRRQQAELAQAQARAQQQAGGSGKKRRRRG